MAEGRKEAKWVCQKKEREIKQEKHSYFGGENFDNTLRAR